MTGSPRTRKRVREYYGRVLSSSRDLKTNACCAPDTVAPYLRAILKDVEAEVKERFYGCGSPIPPAIEGATILDVGCGTGRDAFVCARLVGPQGRVIGLDMTEEQLAIARAHEASQAARFGYDKPNTRFVCGYMEDLRGANIADNTVDVVVSNCVINLAPDKHQVFSEILRVLKPGGELLFSDVFADRRLPAEWLDDQELVGECLAGAMYVEDLRRMLQRFGVPDYRVVASSRITVDDESVEAKVGRVQFTSMTIRAFKLDCLEDRCEDFGQVAYYNGTIPHHPHAFALDDHHLLETGKPMLVCGNTAAMLSETRLTPHFTIVGDRSTHFGLFPCGPAEAAPAHDGGCAPGCC